jgi:hypothetical protein
VDVNVHTCGPELLKLSVHGEHQGTSGSVLNCKAIQYMNAVRVYLRLSTSRQYFARQSSHEVCTLVSTLVWGSFARGCTLVELIARQYLLLKARQCCIDSKGWVLICSCIDSKAMLICSCIDGCSYADVLTARRCYYADVLTARRCYYADVLTARRCYYAHVLTARRCWRAGDKTRLHEVSH